MLKNILKWVGILIGVLFLVVLIGGLIANKSLPEGKAGPEAEALADRMMTAVNCAAWDTIGAVSWKFAGTNTHLWDKKRHYAKVSWGDGMMALVDINARTGVAYRNGEKLTGPKVETIVNAAWKYWVNDAYWLNAPCKIKDAGTERSLVTQEDGSEALRVTYSSGGATPGDSYVWDLDESGKPKSFGMWVSIIPIGGFSSTWEGWETHQGALLAGRHEGLFTLLIENIQTANTAAELAGGTDPFAELVK